MYIILVWYWLIGSDLCLIGMIKTHYIINYQILPTDFVQYDGYI